MFEIKFSVYNIVRMSSIFMKYIKIEYEQQILKKENFECMY